MIADTADPITYTLAAQDNSATVTVLDDESLPVITIAADSGELSESVATASFKLSATGFVAETSIVVYATADGLGSNYLPANVHGKSTWLQYYVPR